MSVRLRLGTRGSPLALAQAHETRDRLIAAFPDLGAPDAVSIVVISTAGDRIQDRALLEAGGKGLFTKEIEQALLDGAIDIAVHSLKDAPTDQPAGLTFAAFLPREDHRDAWISPKAAHPSLLPPGAVVGTASLRRQAFLLMQRPDLRVAPLRGNVETRLRKLAEGRMDATLLAMAGLRRLGLADQATAVLEPETMLPAVAQGVIALQVRAADADTQHHACALDCPVTASRAKAERAMLARLDGSCRTPIAGLALAAQGGLFLRGIVIRPDGKQWLMSARTGGQADAERLGDDLGRELKARLPSDFLMHGTANPGPPL
jgi:hydroxymethylbilane synthase